LANLALGFSNGIGNFLFFMAAAWPLKRQGHRLTLLTDDDTTSYETIRMLASLVFDEVRTRCRPRLYDEVLWARWSMPKAILNRFNVRKLKAVAWSEEGIHEIQEYLEAFGLDNDDLDLNDLYGFWPETDGPELNGAEVRIALANCSVHNVASKKRWDKFPELSRKLVELGCDVYLLGAGDELRGCDGYDLVGKLSLFETAHVLGQCDFLVCSSTGLSVVADVMQVPVVLIEGPMPLSKNHPLLTPYRVVRRYISCAPCFQSSLFNLCGDPICMRSVTVGDVLQVLREWL